MVIINNLGGTYICSHLNVPILDVSYTRYRCVLTAYCRVGQVRHILGHILLQCLVLIRLLAPDISNRN